MARKLIGLLEKKTAEADSWKAKAKARFMWILILIGAIGMWAFIKFRKKIFPKLKF